MSPSKVIRAPLVGKQRRSPAHATRGVHFLDGARGLFAEWVSSESSGKGKPENKATLPLINPSIMYQGRFLARIKSSSQQDHAAEGSLKLNVPFLQLPWLLPCPNWPRGCLWLYHLVSSWPVSPMKRMWGRSIHVFSSPRQSVARQGNKEGSLAERSHQFSGQHEEEHVPSQKRQVSPEDK